MQLWSAYNSFTALMMKMTFQAPCHRQYIQSVDQKCCCYWMSHISHCLGSVDQIKHNCGWCTIVALFYFYKRDVKLQNLHQQFKKKLVFSNVGFHTVIRALLKDYTNVEIILDSTWQEADLNRNLYSRAFETLQALFDFLLDTFI